jgi:glycosyl transferase, family 25
MDQLPSDWCGFLVNLPERKDRLEAAKKELARVGWSLGPAGVTLYAAKRFSDSAGFPSPSARGCFISHSECLKEALRLGKTSVLMLEDDIAFASSLPNLLDSVVTQLNEVDWDFCYFGHEQTDSIKRAGPQTDKVTLVPFQGHLLTTHFYLLNARILSKLVMHLERLANGRPGDPIYGPMPIDGAFNTFRLLNPDVVTLVVDPKLGWQRSSRSDINPGRLDRLHILRPLMTALRNLKNASNR